MPKGTTASDSYQMKPSGREDSERNLSPKARLNGSLDHSLARLSRTKSAIRLLLGRKQTARVEEPYKCKFSEHFADDEEQIKQMDEVGTDPGKRSIQEWAKSQLCHRRCQLTEYLGTLQNHLTINSAQEGHFDAVSGFCGSSSSGAAIEAHGGKFNQHTNKYSHTTEHRTSLTSGKPSLRGGGAQLSRELLPIVYPDAVEAPYDVADPYPNFGASADDDSLSSGGVASGYCANSENEEKQGQSSLTKKTKGKGKGKDEGEDEGEDNTEERHDSAGDINLPAITEQSERYNSPLTPGRFKENKTSETAAEAAAETAGPSDGGAIPIRIPAPSPRPLPALPTYRNAVAEIHPDEMLLEEYFTRARFGRHGPRRWRCCRCGCKTHWENNICSALNCQHKRCSGIGAGGCEFAE
jgi:hypothetical protein